MKANKNLSSKLPEIIVLCLYTLLLALVVYFHEPYFDEAQSWLIARAASIKDMFFYIPHYEGHPPFWWLILAPFAKAGFPYEITLKTVNIVLCSVGVCLFLFKAPFKRLFKFLIPFSFFLFYQYGVISRCYCLTIIAFMLVAISYQNRNIKPFAYVGSLMLLCASSAYGVIFSGGLAIVWLLELYPFSLKEILQKRQFKALALLLAWALFLLFIMIPRPDAFAISANDVKNTFAERFLFLTLVAPLNSIIGLSDFRMIKDYIIPLPDVLLNSLYYLPFTVALLIYLKGFKKLLLFIIPFILFVLFSSIVYLSAWHCGFIFLFLVFIFWQTEKERQPFIAPKFLKEDTIKFLSKAFTGFLFCILCASVWNSFCKSKHDIQNPYDTSRDVARFIKEYKLEDKVIFAGWISYAVTGEPIYEMPTHMEMLTVLPYFDKNIINNLNFGDDKHPYDIHKIVNKDDYYKIWAQGPKPDIKIGDNFPLNTIWKDITPQEDDFTPVYLEEYERLPIFIRSSLAEELGITSKMRKGKRATIKVF